MNTNTSTAGTSKEMKKIECTCEHPYQDKKYGKNKRAMNPCKKGEAYRCSVCGREHNG